MSNPVMRGRTGGARQLPAEFEALARGEKYRPPRRPRISDPRPIALIPGVKNSDARIVYQSRIAELARLAAREDRSELLAALAEVARLRLFRAGALASLDALVENQLELDWAALQAELEESGLDRSPASDEAVAMCLRAEAVLREARAHGRAAVIGSRPDEEISIRMPVEDTAAHLELIGRRVAAVTSGY